MIFKEIKELAILNDFLIFYFILDILYCILYQSCVVLLFLRAGTILTRFLSDFLGFE